MQARLDAALGTGALPVIWSFGMRVSHHLAASLFDTVARSRNPAG